jgi:hypothetical protein
VDQTSANRLNIKVEEPMKMFCDNQSARQIATNPIFHEHTRHIEVDCHFIRKMQSKEMEASFVKSEDQLVDILTKGLSIKTFKKIHTS